MTKPNTRLRFKYSKSSVSCYGISMIHFVYSQWRHFHASSNEMLYPPRPRGLSRREQRRAIDDDYDKQSRCPRGLCFIAHHRVLRGLPHSRTISYPYENMLPYAHIYTHVRAHVYISHKCGKHICGRTRARESRFNITARSTFSRITLEHDLSCDSFTYRLPSDSFGLYAFPYV